jgi:hypothetical protein
MGFNTLKLKIDQILIQETTKFYLNMNVNIFIFLENTNKIGILTSKVILKKQSIDGFLVKMSTASPF